MTSTSAVASASQSPSPWADRNGAIDRLAQQKLGQPIHIACPMRTLASVINEHQVDRVDLLKIDAERCELEILSGITAPHWSRIQQVVMEVHDQEGDMLDQIVTLLKETDFEVAYEQQADGSEAGLFELYAVRC